VLRKRQYLNYRAGVEQEMSLKRAAKYSHGGEGNEHRQYIPLVLKCNLGSGSNPFALPYTPVECCQDPCCQVCSLLCFGMSLRQQNRLSHYCTPNAAAAVGWCRSESPHSLLAVGVCRVVVGTPNFVASTSEVMQPPPGMHACVVTDGNPVDDGTYVFRDEAIDVQSVILFV